MSDPAFPHIYDKDALLAALGGEVMGAGGDYSLRDNLANPDNSLVSKGDDVYLNFGGDLLYLFTVNSNRKNTFAAQLCDMLSRKPRLAKRGKGKG